MEDHGWEMHVESNLRWLQKGERTVALLRKDRVYWLEAEVGTSEELHGLPMCPLPDVSFDEAETKAEDGALPQQVERKARAKTLPTEPTEADRLQHELTHIPPKSRCKHCVGAFGMEDAHRRRQRGPQALPELHMDYMFLGRKDEPGTICIAHAVDIDFGHRIVIRADKGPVEYVIRAICEMLQEIGRKRIIIRTDGEPSVQALAVAVSAFREEETVLEMTSKDNSQGIGTVERGSFLVGATARVLRASVEEKLQWGLQTPSNHLAGEALWVVAEQVRHWPRRQDALREGEGNILHGARSASCSRSSCGRTLTRTNTSSRSASTSVCGSARARGRMSTWSSMTWCTVAGPYSVGRTPDGGTRTSLSRSMRCHGCRSRHG